MKANLEFEKAQFTECLAIFCGPILMTFEKFKSNATPDFRFGQITLILTIIAVERFYKLHHKLSRLQS
uniref:Uncharacterized protein n=1 Tax=Arundo donax TaxID=35708 RepID=A0A0A9BHD2_ARUDO